MGINVDIFTWLSSNRNPILSDLGLKVVHSLISNNKSQILLDLGYRTVHSQKAHLILIAIIGIKSRFVDKHMLSRNLDLFITYEKMVVIIYLRQLICLARNNALLTFPNYALVIAWVHTKPYFIFKLQTSSISWWRHAYCYIKLM